MNEKESTLEDLLHHLEKKILPYQAYEFPQLSIVIPVHNCAQSIVITLDSILSQNYPDFEVIIVDAESTDRTLEIIKGYREERIHIYTVAENRSYAMLNHGISQAKGKYINFLFPGDFYLTPETHKFMMSLALQYHLPDLLYCGTLLRDGKSDVKMLYRKLSLKLLKRGQQPSSLQSFWFKKELFHDSGYFNPTYRLRGGYEILCRFSLMRDLQVQSTTRILTDYDLRWVTKQLILTHFWETLRVIWTYFGVKVTVNWLYHQKDIKRYGKLWWRSLRIAFIGR